MRMTVDRSSQRYRSTVGFNPFRDQQKSAIDVAIFVVAIVATLAAIAWAILST